MQILKTSFVMLAFLSIGILQSCSSQINDSYVGLYDSADSTGHIEIVNRDGSMFGDKGMCLVTLEPIEGRSQYILDTKCKVEENSIMMTMERPNKDHFYPEFRGTTAILTIDKHTLITQTGRKFIKR